jgi:hypothetical protein
VEQAVESPVVEQAVEPPVVEQAVESPVVEQAVESPVVEQAVEPAVLEQAIEPAVLEQADDVCDNNNSNFRNVSEEILVNVELIQNKVNKINELINAMELLLKQGFNVTDTFESLIKQRVNFNTSLMCITDQLEKISKYAKYCNETLII